VQGVVRLVGYDVVFEQQPRRIFGSMASAAKGFVDQLDHLLCAPDIAALDVNPCLSVDPARDVGQGAFPAALWMKSVS